MSDSTNMRNGLDNIGSDTARYKLLYFDVRGRGEIPRLLFHAAGVKFTDFRVTDEEKWYKHMKASKCNNSMKM